MSAAILFVLCFMASTFLHLFQMFKKQTWFLVPVVMGGFFEWIGYIGRALSSNDQWALGPYLVQTIALRIAPALFSASMYVVLSRIMALVGGGTCSIISKRWLTRVLVCGDILSLVLQSTGVGIMAGGSLSSIYLGECLIVIGMFVQIVFLNLFLFVTLAFHKHIRRSLTMISTYDSPIGCILQRDIFTLYMAAAFIMVRSIFRVVERFTANTGFHLRHEIFSYIFDATLMLSVMVLFNINHPGNLRV
ncbi:hypothetical protein OIDMADRAFT_62327 [Oidiodendron maius Zn]|uniref:RTA1 like protein n=1 Tax=Oidiodendron maius (strain Zn) TaxID=913774 RepID=A0A0C3GQD3_OIDMZ|nr:hypothetical protein OIDMADRAFT_62327 [Oidiodendron maius Zn]